MIISAFCLALNVYFEARGEPLDGQLAVIDVVINRTLSDRYPDTVCEVVFQPKQFSWTLSPRKSSEDPLWPVLELVLSDLSLGITSTHYHTTSIRPYWASAFPLDGRIANHVFYTEGNPL